MRRTTPLFPLLFLLFIPPGVRSTLAAEAPSSPPLVCFSSVNRSTEVRLTREVSLYRAYVKNTLEQIKTLEDLLRSSKQVARGSTLLFAASASTLAIAASAEVVAFAGAGAATSTAMKVLARGAGWVFKWRTGGNTALGIAWEYASNSAVAILLNDKWSSRKLRPIIGAIDEIGKYGWQPDRSGPGEFARALEKEHARLAALEKQASTQLHDNRLLSLGWDDVRHIDVLLAAAKARYRLFALARDEAENSLWEIKGQCDEHIQKSLQLVRKAKEQILLSSPITLDRCGDYSFRR